MTTYEGVEGTCGARFWLGVAWIVIIIGGSVVMMLRNITNADTRARCMVLGGFRLGIVDGKRVGYETVRCLPANHRLTDADLIRPGLPSSIDIPRPEFRGKYLRLETPAGKALHPEDLRDDPLVEARGGEVIAVVVGAGATAFIDAGSMVDIYANGQPFTSGEVIAVVGSDSSTAIVHVNGEPPKKAVSPTDKVVLVVRGRRKDACMQPKVWTVLKELDVVPTTSPWVLALEFVPAGTLLKIESSGKWRYVDNPATDCGPDGDFRASAAAADLAVSDTPIGCLIGKIGGASAKRDGTVFVAGSFGVVSVTDPVGGPLFLGMNVALARVPTPAAAPAAAPSALHVKISEGKP